MSDALDADAELLIVIAKEISGSGHTTAQKATAQLLWNNGREARVINDLLADRTAQASQTAALLAADAKQILR